MSFLRTRDEKNCESRRGILGDCHFQDDYRVVLSVSAESEFPRRIEHALGECGCQNMKYCKVCLWFFSQVAVKVDML